ncbi:MAG: hypothetical protein H7A25_02170 [Leptospiraceae bacterium]|nr:hypothetical protein [Leptospiraceae bacterium]
MKHFFLNISTIIMSLLICIRGIEADSLILKNGKKYEGVYISETKKEITFNINFTDEKTFKRREVKELIIDIVGLPSEYILYSDKNTIQKAKLFALDAERAVFIGETPKGEKEVLDYNASEIYKLQAKKENRSQKLSTVLHKGVKLKLQLKNEDLQEGELKEVNKESGEITLEEKKYKEKELKGIVFEGPYKDPLYVRLYNGLKLTIPGWVELEREETKNKIKGGFLLSSFLIFGAAIPYYYSKAIAAEQNDIDLIPLGSQVYLFQNFSPSNAYSFHRQNYMVAAGLFGLVYAYHGFEIYGKELSGNKKISVNLFSNPFFHETPINPSFEPYSKQFGFSINFRF